MDQAELQELFGGAPGTPVPEVDPMDIKSLWEHGQDLRRRHPEGGVATGMAVLERLCKPGASIKAVIYRATKIEMLRTVSPEVIEPLLQEKLDAVFQTAATIPMEWIGVGAVHHGWSFDPDEFVRRVREAA